MSDDTPMWVDAATGQAHPRTWASFRDGLIPWSELDNEELSRLQVRNKNGQFVGTAPRVIPRDLAQAHARELIARNDKLMKDVITRATQVFVDVVDSSTASDADKMRAAQYLHDRILGKTPDKVEVKAELKPWEALVEDVDIDTE